MAVVCAILSIPKALVRLSPPVMYVANSMEWEGSCDSRNPTNLRFRLHFPHETSSTILSVGIRALNLITLDIQLRS